MNAALRFDYGELSHPGRVRTNNEDAYISRPADGVYVVADGMGGHETANGRRRRSSRKSSASSCRSISTAAWTVLGEALHTANATIWDEAQSRGLQMGSTVVMLLVRGTRSRCCGSATAVRT